MPTSRILPEREAHLEARTNSESDDWAPVPFGQLFESGARRIAREQNTWLGWAKWRVVVTPRSAVA